MLFFSRFLKPIQEFYRFERKNIHKQRVLFKKSPNNVFNVFWVVFVGFYLSFHLFY